MNKVIDKGFRSCRFVSTIVKHPVCSLNHFLQLKCVLNLTLTCQSCSRERNLRDRDLVKNSRPRDFIKNSETEIRDLKLETETRDSKFVHFVEFF